MVSSIENMSEAEVARCRGDDREQGFGSLRTERGALPLEAMRVEAKIDGLISRVSLRQTFINTIGEPMEATYIFPLPDRSAVTSFKMEIAGRIIDGLIEERQQARERYDRAIQSGHRAAITEEERPGVFTMRVGNIMPNERATVHLTLTGVLPFDDGDVTFRFPLVVAPRYIPGVALGGEDVGRGVAFDTDAVPDASRITPPVLLPGFPNPVRLEIEVHLRDGGLPLSNLRSSLHAIDQQAKRVASGGGWEGSARAGHADSEGGVRVLKIGFGERLDRDFILRGRLAERDIRSSLLLRPDDRGDEGTFLLTVVPPAAAGGAPKPRDVVFLIDRSGSMQGWKMVAARRAVARMVDSLVDQDRFTVLAFDDHIESPPNFQSGVLNATDRNRFSAVEYLASIDARGGTEMAEPLERAASQLAGGYQDRERAIVLVTDGQIGNEDQILRALGPTLKNVRVFSVGIDQAVNAAFLKRLSALGAGGTCELVESEDRLDEVMDRIHRRIGTPVLTELVLRGHDLAIDPRSVSPHRLPDLFAGVPVVIGGRYRGQRGSVQLSGTDTKGGAWSETMRGEVTSNDAIASVWARARVRELEDRYVLASDSALEREIVSTSIKFSVLCRFTAFVAVDQAERVNVGGQVNQVTQPVETPAGWGAPISVEKLMRSGTKIASALHAPAPSSPPMAQRISASAGKLDDAFSDYDSPLEALEYERGIASPAKAPMSPPKPAPAPRLEKKSKAKGKDRKKEAIDLVEQLRLTKDPDAAIQLLVTELPRAIEERRNRGEDVRALEELLVEILRAIAGAEAELRALITRAIDLLEPTGRSRGAFWR